MEEVKDTAEPVVPEEPKSHEINIKIIETPGGYMINKIEGEFPVNDIFIRGVFSQAKSMILGRLAQKRMQEEIRKNRIVKPDMVGSLRAAGKKVSNIFK